MPVERSGSYSYFVLDEPVLTYFRSWSGTLGHSFGRLEKESVWRQKQLVHKRSGHLTADISSKRATDTRGNLRFDAGSKLRYAAAYELGSRPHVIAAKHAPVLVFFWPKVGHVMHLQKVHHPGTRAYHHLTQGVESAMQMWERGG